MPPQYAQHIQQQNQSSLRAICSLGRELQPTVKRKGKQSQAKEGSLVRALCDVTLLKTRTLKTAQTTPQDRI